MSEFDGIDGFDGWSAKLSELLQASQEAAQADEWPPRLVAANRLTEFMARSHPNTPDILGLDEIANQAAAGLLRQTIEERLQAIAGRQADLVRLTKKIAATAEAAQEAAASIRLERAQKAIGALTDSILQLRGFREVLQGGAESQMVAAVEKLIASMQRVRKDIENSS